MSRGLIKHKTAHKVLSAEYERTLSKMFKELAVAGTKSGWEPVFRTQTPSQRQVLQKWSTHFQVVVNIAAKHGLELLDPTVEAIDSLGEELSEVDEMLGT